MKVRFIIVAIVTMVVLLLSSVLITYTTISSSQNAFDKEILSLAQSTAAQSAANNSEMQKKVALYKAFSQKQTVDTTRKLLLVFLIDIAMLSILYFFFIYGVTNPIYNLSGKVKSFYFDKSEKELLLEEMGAEEVRVLIRAVNDMVVKLKNYEKILGNVSKYRGWKEISRIIVHEINNIVSPIQTYVEYLSEKVEDKEKISFILAKLNDIRSILGKFRGISHLPDANLEEQNIYPLILEICKEFKNIRFKTEDDRPVLLKIDNVLFKEIMRNLVKNAVESGEKVNVDVEVFNSVDKAVIIVKDDGKGIPKECLHKIFEPGFSTKKGNIGIGLSIVKSLAQEQNAQLDVESEVGKGTSFRIIFQRL